MSVRRIQSTRPNTSRRPLCDLMEDADLRFVLTRMEAVYADLERVYPEWKRPTGGERLAH